MYQICIHALIFYLFRKYLISANRTSLLLLWLNEPRSTKIIELSHYFPAIFRSWHFPFLSFFFSLIFRSCQFRFLPFSLSVIFCSFHFPFLCYFLILPCPFCHFAYPLVRPGYGLTRHSKLLLICLEHFIDSPNFDVSSTKINSRERVAVHIIIMNTMIS